ncbi:MAG: UvrD-helicase domain-containing protein [Treponema sp.]|jgi:DNA helicase-2/ATP-dependent DNA helicase PcrA|nr:UvrD-helicase domain-containing protein [Treponema sp.]
MRFNPEQELNPPQMEAVLSIDGPVLIIAGAGSGKTRVITYRIARMLDAGIPQRAILALTFTNKAAREMESRVKELTGKKLQSLTVSTFHAFGVRILREEIEALGYRKNFSIYDETDKTELIKECLREERLGNSGVNFYALGQLFSGIKTGRFSRSGAPGLAETAGTVLEAAVREKVYNEYQRSLKIYNAVDFDDLITLPIELFENHPDVLEKYRRRYRYIMVDEFQDTSLVQYRLIRLLALDAAMSPNSAVSPNSAGTPNAAISVEGPGADGVNGTANVCVVGDDDQSIYSWRGANYENILLFEKDFPGRREIKLEQNYRSTSTILEAANGLISHNKSRKEKKLWSGNSGGKPIELYYPSNETEEADFISARIGEHMIRDDGRKYDDFGILLRTNAMTRQIEEALLESNIPYRVSGGQSFFQRKEIKDILSYLRIIANEHDDINLLRIINTPRRGIGKTAVAAIAGLAGKAKTSLWDAMSRIRARPDDFSLDSADSGIAARTEAEISAFVECIEGYRETFLGSGKGLAEKTRALVDDINYWPYLVAEHSKNEKIAKWKYGNIEYFIRAIENWEKDPDNPDTGLYAWLNRISLITRDDGDDEAAKGKVNLMTIHAAKGLEFPVVFIAGAEDGIIPHTRSMETEDPAGSLEEERRLFYVAITRARDKLYVTSCQKRRRLQDTADCVPSPFLAEIPPGLVELRDGKERPQNPEDTEAFFAKIRGVFRNGDGA